MTVRQTHMKAATTTLLALLLATSAFAQTEPAPDYSRPTLLRIVVEAEREKERGIRFEGGALRFVALGTRWSFPTLMLPLPGTRFGTTMEWPDAFALTNTPIAYRPGTYPTRREISRELKRIERVTAKVKVTTKSD